MEGDIFIGFGNWNVNFEGATIQPICGLELLYPQGLDWRAGRREAGQGRLTASGLHLTGRRKGTGVRRPRAQRPHASSPGLAPVGATSTGLFLEEQNCF